MEESIIEKKHITVKLRFSTGDIMDYNFDLSQLTVLQFKERLAIPTTIPANKMRLVYSGRVLKDEDLVESYGVKEGHTIHVVRSAANRAAEQAANSSTNNNSRNPNNNPSINPFTLNLLGLGGSFDQDVMRNMMNSPMIRHLLSNPEIVRSMVMQNPAMRQMIERNPEIGHIINDPSFIRQTMDMARNPELMREMMRNNDRALANLETIPGGFNHLRRMYHTLQEPLESAGRNNEQLSEAANQRLAQILNVEKPPEGRINTTPLPNPWAPRNNNNLGSLGGITSSGNVTNPFGGIPSFSLMGFPPNQAPFQSLSTNTNNRLPNNNSQLNNGSPAPTNNTSSQPSSTNGPQNFPSVRFSSHPRSLPTSSNPDFIRFQQIMQRYIAPTSSQPPSSQPPSSSSPSSSPSSSQYPTTRQPGPQTFFHQFGSHSPFFTNNVSPPPALRRSFQTTSTTPTTSTATSTPTSTTSSSPSTVATSTTSTTPQPIHQSSEPPEARFREQLRNLKDMGFMDQAANIRALLAAGGDVNSAVDLLLQNSNL